jgi:hypothetical protein
MPVRTTKRSIVFEKPFRLAGYDRDLPAGRYVVETDEELVEGISFPVYRRVLTILHLAARNGNPNLMRTVTVDPADLEAALARDQPPDGLPSDTGPEAAVPLGEPKGSVR